MSIVGTQSKSQIVEGGTIAARGSYLPLKRNGALDKYPNFEVTPVIGQEFSEDAQLSKIVADDNAVKDLAVLISQRGVVFFRHQDLDIEAQRTLADKLGKLSGRPESSGLYIHPLTEDTSAKGDVVSIITSERRANFLPGDISKFASSGWHSDISFEPVPSDYVVLKIHTNDPVSGGDTLWASAYELYDRLSPEFARFLEGLKVHHGAPHFRDVAKSLGNELRTGTRGSPLNNGDDLGAVHPLIRTNPVTGWKGVYINKGFAKRILGISKDESDLILKYLDDLTIHNHDLQVRFRWSTDHSDGRSDIALWDNRSTQHNVTFDYTTKRVGDRVVSVGEKPYFDPQSQSRRQALGLSPH